MKKIKVLAFILAITTILMCFAGCGSTNYGKIKNNDDGKTSNLDAELVEFFAYSMISQYASYGYDATTIKDLLSKEQDGVTGEKAMKDEILNAYKQFMAVEAIAEKEGISLTADELKSLEDSKNQQITQAGGRAKFIEQLDASHLSEELYDKLQKNLLLQNKVFNALYNPGGRLAPSDDEVLANTIASFEGAARSKHILIQATQGGADYAEKQKIANEALARAVAGEDFDALIEQYGEDPGMTTNVNGYIFYEDGMLIDGSTSLMPEYVKGSFAVQPGTVNPALVQTSYGFHIIKRLPLDAEYAKANLSEYYSSYASSLFAEQIGAVSANLEIEATKDFEALDLSTFLSHEGHNH